ncbi:metal-sensitive transcriptional regulator [Anaerobacillus sp. CMMVII]|uniref:metal-sensitive transcriptional regulator n=1 Tax=Anaerobacillus sp. CMMVII TaxID=2755588 RepID=UPI0021B7A988|nr:metal-sensitive transcriptional regulator [Anaerobacillus sp. CMMVII]MCT8136556.1 metal-sensitive transcriptional regulator [Anaerobacillus sp. CMMVII]
MEIYDDKVKNRLKRIEGQVRGIIRMMEEEKQCHEVVTQLAAVRNAIDRAIGVVVSSNLEECIRKQIENGEGTEETIKEAVNLLVKSR